MDALADLDLIVIDESFIEFADAEHEPSVVEDAVIRPNVVVLRSLGKNFGLHGIRFGYMVANPALAGKIRSMLPKWNLNSFAETVVFMLKNHGQEYVQSLRMVRRDRLDMAQQLAHLPGLTVYPSQGNFLFVRLPVGAEGTVVRDRLLTEHRILVRECGNKIGSSSRFLRLVVRPQVDVRRLVSGLEEVLYGTRRGAAVPEMGNGTNYSSGTAAVDRLVGATNGAGMQGLAAQAAAMPSLAPAQTAAWPGPAPAQNPGAMPGLVPAAAPAAMMPPPRRPDARVRSGPGRRTARLHPDRHARHGRGRTGPPARHDGPRAGRPPQRTDRGPGPRPDSARASPATSGHGLACRGCRVQPGGLVGRGSGEGAAPLPRPPSRACHFSRTPAEPRRPRPELVQRVVSIPSRRRARVRVRRRETCIWDTPRCSPICDWVSSSTKRSCRMIAGRGRRVRR